MYRRSLVPHIAALTATVTMLAAWLATCVPYAQALPAGVHCVTATAANEVTPPPPLWELKHEPRPANLPKPLCASGMAPAVVPATNISATTVPMVPPPKEFGEIEPLMEEPLEKYKPFYYAGDAWNNKTQSWAGMSGQVEVGNPTLSETAGVHSLGEIADVNNSEVTYSMELGWSKDPALGTNSRLFTYINKDHYKSNGEPGGDCYNCMTPVTGAAYTQNEELTVGSDPLFTVLYEAANARWWVAVGNSWFAYEPGSFWSSKFTTGIYMPIWGEVNDKSGPNSQMGNGKLGTEAGSLTMGDPYLWKNENENITVAGHPIPSENVYPENVPDFSVGQYSSNKRQWHYGGRPGA